MNVLSRRWLTATVRVALVLIVSGCARPSLAPAAPARAPDSISDALWDSLNAPANLMADPPGLRGRWARNVMMVSFMPTATQAERQAIIDLIHGEVLGGNTWPMGEGEYIVRIPYATAPGDSISGPVLRAFLALRGHPAIMAAYPLSMDNFSRIYDLTPQNSAGGPSGVTLIPPDFFPKALFDSLGTVTSASSGNRFRKDIVTIDFRIGTSLAVRQAIIDSIGGVVVGGAHYEVVNEGTYYVQIHGGTMDALLAALRILHRQPAVAMAGWWELTHPDESAHRKPDDGFGFKE